MKSKIKLITKKCEYLTEIIKFKDLNCNFQQNSDELKKKGNIIILGNFDGVHKGHMTIFQNAITRAKEKLFISSTKSMTMYGKLNIYRVSSFVDEIINYVDDKIQT